MKYTKIRDVKDPTGNRKEDNGIDLFIPNDFPKTILRIGEQVNIPSGIKVKVPANKTFRLENKSGVALKKGLVRGACVVDIGYRGEIHLNLFKVVKGTEDIKVRCRGLRGLLGFKEWATVLNPGDKIVQGIIEPTSQEAMEYITTEEYEKGPKTQRQDKGFGKGTGSR